MKHSKIFSVILSFALLTACDSAQPVQTSETVSESEISAVTTASETVSETEPAEIADENEIEYVEVSPNNEFIDFEFIENYQGTTDIGDLADKAVEFLKTTDFYADSMKNISEFSDEEFSDYISDGVIVPKLSIAYPNDYDGDGREETFIMVDMPYKRSNVNVIRNFLIFADSGGHMEVLSDFSFFDTNSAQLLDYGKFKQIVIGAYGIVGADDHTILFGVTDGKVKKLYSGRISFYKSDCFVCTFGWQGSGDFMYYDTSADEYRSIIGKPMTIDEIKAMDKDLTLKEYYDWYDENGYAIFVFIGGKYYNAALGPMDTGNIYTYENGRFVLSNDTVRRTSDDYGLKKVADIDIDKAIAEMKPPKEPFAQVSPDNEFIDFEFIENYQGTTDIGDLADKAVQLVKGTEEYKYFSENISEFSEESLREIYTYASSETAKEWAESFYSYIDADGNIQPKISAAFTEDYDGDGSTETFMIVSAAKAVHSTEFLLFADSFGKTEILGEYDNCCTEAFLNYGKTKQLIVGGGSYGVNTHSDIWGVRDGKAVRHYSSRCSYEKADCFLSVSGFQGRDDFLYFDTGALEYRAVAGIKVPAAEIREMDKSGVFADVDIEMYENAGLPWGFRLIGGKYYSLKETSFGDKGIYTYENGGFVLNENSKIKLSINEHGLPIVKDIDIDKAAAEMKPPKK